MNACTVKEQSPRSNVSAVLLCTGEQDTGAVLPHHIKRDWVTLLDLLRALSAPCCPAAVIAHKDKELTTTTRTRKGLGATRLGQASYHAQPYEHSVLAVMRGFLMLRSPDGASLFMHVSY